MMNDDWLYENIEQQYAEAYYQLWLAGFEVFDLKYYLIEQGMGL